MSQSEALYSQESFNYLVKEMAPEIFERSYTELPIDVVTSHNSNVPISSPTAITTPSCMQDSPTSAAFLGPGSFFVDMLFATKHDPGPDQQLYGRADKILPIGFPSGLINLAGLVNQIDEGQPLKSLYTKNDEVCSLRCCLSTAQLVGSGPLYVRFTALHQKLSYRSTPVQTCAKCKERYKLRHEPAAAGATTCGYNSNSEAAQHFILVENTEASYQRDQRTGHRSVVVPLFQPTVGTDSPSYNISFPCHNSDQSPQEAKDIIIVVELESHGHTIEVLGRDRFSVRVCASPGRDLDTYRNYNRPVKRPRISRQDPPTIQIQVNSGSGEEEDSTQVLRGPDGEDYFVMLWPKGAALNFQMMRPIHKFFTQLNGVPDIQRREATLCNYFRRLQNTLISCTPIVQQQTGDGMALMDCAGSSSSSSSATQGRRIKTKRPSASMAIGGNSGHSEVKLPNSPQAGSMAPSTCQSQAQQQLAPTHSIYMPLANQILQQQQQQQQQQAYYPSSFPFMSTLPSSSAMYSNNFGMHLPNNNNTHDQNHNALQDINEFLQYSSSNQVVRGPLSAPPHMLKDEMPFDLVDGGPLSDSSAALPSSDSITPRLTRQATQRQMSVDENEADTNNKLRRSSRLNTAAASKPDSPATAGLRDSFKKHTSVSGFLRAHGLSQLKHLFRKHRLIYLKTLLAKDENFYINLGLSVPQSEDLVRLVARYFTHPKTDLDDALSSTQFSGSSTLTAESNERQSGRETLTSQEI